MKKRILFLVCMLILPIVTAQGWLFNSEYIELDMDISSKIILVPQDSNYKVNYVTANLSFVPRNDFQEEVVSIETEPSTQINKENIVFRWDNPNQKELKFSVKSKIKSFNKIVKIRNKVNFPLTDLPDEVMIYTKPSETIDSDNKDIVKMASEIVKGEDDLYVIAFKLGDWTKNNVDYDLSTLTESVSQTASWVLENREGVCDELTNLFIAMSRSLGIPAKFISGVAYTNAEQFEEGFGPHGWAEVYFPDYGWVPFDVTYGEFGFIDAGHVKLKESVDANDASTQFQWLGQNIDIQTSPLDINTNIKGTKGKISELISIDAKAVKNDVSFGSYNLIEVDVENLRNYYVATELVLSKPREIEIIGEIKNAVLLKPNEKKTISWIIKVSNNLDRGYMYTFPFVVSSLRNVSSSIQFDVIEDGKRFSLEGIESLIQDDESEKSYLGSITLNCKSDKDGMYEDEIAIVECNIKNIGNVYLGDLNVCLEDECKKISLGITQEDMISLNFKPKEIGSQEIVVKASNKDVSQSVLLDIDIYDKPIIEIKDIIYPEEVEYEDIYEISMVLDKKSMFAPQDVNIKIEVVNQEWDIEKLKESRKFVLKMYGNELKAGENNFKILVSYKDKKGNSYETGKNFNIKLVNVNVFQRIAIFFKHLFR